MTDTTRVRRAGLVLLVLMLHAIQAGATHFPRAAQKPTAQTSQDASLAESWGQAASAESSGHAQCLLCRLQRSLSAGLKNAAPVAFTPPQDSLLVESDKTDALHVAPPGVAHGRAPPLS